jgi:2-hydroxy-3-keto-5-methylthiopentenyl-1-phosphate phosphatase
MKPSIDTLFVVTDFNKTLTKAFVNGEKRKSVIALLRDKWFLDEEYSSITQGFFDKYSKIEKDMSLSLEHRQSKMEERRWKHYTLLIQKKLHKKHILEIVSEWYLELREWVIEFFDMCNRQSVPIVIISSWWLWDFLISESLKHFWVDISHTYIISNHLVRDTEWYLADVKKPYIHWLNKNISMISSFPF